MATTSSPTTEEVQRFWDARPCNVRHSLQPIGTRAYFDEVEQRKATVEPHIAELAQYELWDGKDVLEIGCGIGTETVRFARAGARVVSIDLSPKSVELAQQRVRVYELEAQATVLQADAERLDEALREAGLGDRRFDLVYSFGVLHHTPRPELALAAAARVAKPDAELRIMVYSLVSFKAFQFMHEKGPWDMSKMRRTVEHWAEAQSGCPIARVFAEDEARALVEPHFAAQRVEKRHIFIFDIPAYIEHRLEIASEWRDVPPADLARLERELGWHTLVWAKRADQRPRTASDDCCVEEAGAKNDATVA